ncbi:MAG: magnesium-dependent phosphatase-1 [Armatimonadota bacterium]|nr:magnesium-dependent phosphatase-1 [Armatimonadota bacterium]
MAVRLVILDCDRTLWDHRDVTGLARPFRRVGPDTVEDQAGVRVTLFPQTRPLLAGLRQRGVIVACASWNEPAPVDEIFALLEIGGYFDYRKVEPHPDKHRTIGALLDELARRGAALVPSEVLYVDDRRIHLEAIRREVGPIRFLHYGVDIYKLTDVLDYVDADAR